MFGRWRKTPHGLEGHPLYRLALQVQRGKLTLEEASERVDSTRELRDLADNQLTNLDRRIGDVLAIDRGLAFTLASLNHAVAKQKGFRRVQVDSALRLSELTYNSSARAALLRDALEASRKSGYRRGEKTALSRLAEIYVQEGRVDEAIACYREQIEGAKAGGYAAIDVESLLALGDLYRERGTIDEALDVFERAVRAAGAAGQPRGQIEALTRAAELHFLRGTPTVALGSLEQGLVIAEAARDRELEAELATLLGDLLRELRRVDEALAAYGRALALSGEDVGAQMRILRGLVPLCAEAGRWEATADYARQGLLLSSGAEPALEVAWLLDLALALLELGRGQEGVDAARDALIIARAIDPGGQLVHDALGRLGTVLAECGEWDEATATLEEALTLSNARGDREAEATWLTHLARAAWYTGDTATAVRRYDEALGGARATGDRPLQAHILGSLGTLLREGGQPRRSLEYYQEALDLGKLAGEGREVVRYLTLLGRTYSELRQPDDARRSFLEALALARRIDDKRGLVEVHRRFAVHLGARRDREGTLAQLEAATAIVGELGDPRLDAATLGELAAAQEEFGRREESAASYRRLLANAEGLEDLAAT
ncbi:MAG: Adenylate cyclase, partial [uncultured Thermomicrobiales bacterium]